MTGEAKTVKKAHVWARDPDDWYVEPRWCADALFAMHLFDGIDAGVVIDPFCGLGRILDAAADAGYPAIGMDIRDRGAKKRHEFYQRAFGNNLYTTGLAGYVPPHAAIVVTNPPYKDGIDLFERVVAWGAAWTALLLRSKWANGGGKNGQPGTSHRLQALPLRYVLACAPRPSMPPGAVILAHADGARDEDGNKISIGGGVEDYSWYVFERGYSGRPEFGWCRREFAKAAA